MHYKQTLWNHFLICKWNTQLQRFNMTLSASVEWRLLRVVYVCIVCATAPRGWRGVRVKDGINRKYAVGVISLINSNWEQRGWRCFAHTQQPWPRGHCGWREHMYCRDRASLDMSFKTRMLSRCSIFILLQVSDRSLGQHIVSGTCQLSIGQDLCSVQRQCEATCLSSRSILIPLSNLFFTLSLDAWETITLFSLQKPLFDLDLHLYWRF